MLYTSYKFYTILKINQIFFGKNQNYIFNNLKKNYLSVVYYRYIDNFKMA